MQSEAKISGIGQLKWNWFGQTRPLRDIEKFDEATRGPVGAFKLLWTVKGRLDHEFRSR